MVTDPSRHSMGLVLARKETVMLTENTRVKSFEAVSWNVVVETDLIGPGIPGCFKITYSDVRNQAGESVIVPSYIVAIGRNGEEIDTLTDLSGVYDRPGSVSRVYPDMETMIEAMVNGPITRYVVNEIYGHKLPVVAVTGHYSIS